MFKKNLTHKKTIKKAEKLFDYFNLLKSFTKEKYPLLEDEDFYNQQLLILKIDILIGLLKDSTKKYLSNEISIIEFDKELTYIIDIYDNLRLKNPILNAIIYGYLTIPSGGSAGTPVPNTYSLEYLFKRLKNPDEEI